jgi:hypothetical protein
MGVLKAIHSEFRRRVNWESVTTAKAALAFVGDGKITVKDFLPFPDQDKPKLPMTPRTARIFLKLLKSGELPGELASILGDDIDQIREIAGGF